ncbi:MAG: hypothetical protein FWG02_03105 [Holophagaceae bacterium]|nr:hypothetical protein [Holophagaceae bacterium]
MHLSKNITKIGLFLLLCQLLALGSYIFAQQIPGQWVDDLYLVSINDSTAPPSLLVDENNIIRKKILPLVNADGFPISGVYLSVSTNMCWHEGALYTLAYGGGKYETNKDGTKFKRWTLAKWEDESWHLVGSYNTDITESLKIIPCDNGRFIAISKSNMGTDLNGNSGPDRTPFVRMSIPEGSTQLKISAPIAHRMGEDIPLPSLFRAAYLSRVIIAGKFAVLLSKSTGLYWIFSLETATLKHAGKIFGKATPEWVVNNGNSTAILCANPEKDGTVLISAQEEDAILSPDAGDAQREFNKANFNKPPDLQNKSIIDLITEAEQTIKAREKELRDKNPFAVWHRIYPEVGEIDRDVFPEGAALIREESDIWRPMPDGTVKMGVPIFTYIEREKPKQESEKDSSNTTNK